MRISFIPYLRKRNATSTGGTLYIRVTVERKHIYISLFEYLETKHWSSSRYIVKSSHPNSSAINDLLLSTIASIHQKVLIHKLSGLPVNFTTIRDLLKPAVCNMPKNTFAAVVHEYMAFANVKEGRAKQYRTTLSLHKREKLPELIQELTEKHFVQLQQNLVRQGTAYNTILSHFKRYRAVLSWSMDRSMIAVNPVAKIRLGAWQTKIEFLSVNDLAAIKNALPALPAELQNIGKVFLFCCFTGLRFGDAMALQPENLIDTENGKALHYRQAKTSKQELLPMLPQALKLWPEIQGLKYSNQYFNRALKDIGKAAGLTTNITAHIARHTFATIAINKGIRLEVVQKLLGHANIKTTQGYAHLMQSTKFTELSKWDE
ncbi:MAG: tyrosine-type recombinase/integrase [Bacteroidetes bacterium]|uniref:site-specific integrase n=1 Tax=Phnomibacter sp. TaxID=2836217 RepID=UPI002FDEACC6|nr:tyrosine-type recombinase/integrase [Bacteroidota bacterium]